MAIAVDQTSIGFSVASGTGISFTFNTTATVASSGFIVLGIGCFGGDTLVSVSGGGLTWTIDKQSGGAASKEVAIVSAQAPSGLASGTTLTVTYSTGSATARTLCGTSFTGVKTSSPVDGTPPATSTVSTAAWTSNSATIADGSLLVGHNYNEGAVASNTPTAPSIEAHDHVNSPDAYGIVLEYRIEASAGAYTVAGTWDAARPNSTVAVAYLAAADAGTVDTTTRRYQIRRSRMTSW